MTTTLSTHGPDTLSNPSTPAADIAKPDTTTALDRRDRARLASLVARTPNVAVEAVARYAASHAGKVGAVEFDGPEALRLLAATQVANDEVTRLRHEAQHLHDDLLVVRAELGNRTLAAIASLEAEGRIKGRAVKDDAKALRDKAKRPRRNKVTKGDPKPVA